MPSPPAPSPATNPDRLLDRLALAGLLLFVAGRCLVPMDETDLWFNLRQGEVILQTHGVPTHNLLSFTHPEARDINLAWLFQVLLALVYRVGGVPGTVILKTGFALAVVAALYRTARQRGAHPAVAAAVLGLATWALEQRLGERPHLVTFLGLALLLQAVERAEAGRPRMLWAFVPAALVWANANSCLFEAPAFLLLYAAGARFDARRTAADAERLPRARWAGLVAAGMAPFIVATPSHVHALGYIANHFRMLSVRPLQEYDPAVWPEFGPFFLLGAALLGGALASPRRVPLRHLLPAVVWFALGWWHRRFTAEFAIFAGPLVAALWSERLGALAARAESRIAVAAGAGRVAPWLVVAGIATLALAPRVAAARAHRPWLDLGIEEGLVPLRAVDFLDKHHLEDALYNDMEVGSYLTWRFGPEHRVFQDPRINAYPESFHREMVRTYAPDYTAAEWEAFLARWNVKAALLSYPWVNPRAGLFDPARWAPVLRDRDALVFVRRLPEHHDILAEAELPLTFTYDRQEGTMIRPIDQRPADSAVRPCEWERRRGDFLFEMRQYREALRAFRLAMADGMDCILPAERQGMILQVSGLQSRVAGPADQVELLKDLPDPVSKTNRGFALLGVGRPAEALVDLDRALELSPENLEARYGRAVALSALGRAADAIKAFRVFLATAPAEHVAHADAEMRLDVLLGKRPPPPPPGAPGMPPGGGPGMPPGRPGPPGPPPGPPPPPPNMSMP